MEKNKIQELVFSFLSSINVKSQETSSGIWKILVPPEEKTFFNGFDEYYFTFDRTLAEKHREVELICEGSYLLRKIIERLSGTAKVSRLFAIGEPELPFGEPGKSVDLRLLAPGKVYYRQKVAFTFKVIFYNDRRFDKLFTVIADPASNAVYLSEGAQEIDLQKYRETPEPGIPIEESSEEILRMYLMACRELETRLMPDIQKVKETLQKSYQEEYEKIEKYLLEQKQELLKKKENISFHLYFFQKEEEIDKMIRSIDEERARKIEELNDKYKLKVDISLLSAVLMCIPTLGVSASYIAKRKREILENAGINKSCASEVVSQI